MKTRLILIAALLLLRSRPAWAQTDATTLTSSNKVNRDLVKVAAVQICGCDKGDPRREGYDAVDELISCVRRASSRPARHFIVV